MMENFAESNEISFVSLSDVPVKEFFESKEITTLKCNTNHDTVTISIYREIHENPNTECLLDQIAEERQ